MTTRSTDRLGKCVILQSCREVRRRLGRVILSLHECDWSGMQHTIDRQCMQLKAKLRRSCGLALALPCLLDLIASQRDLRVGEA